jgi:hypothetical protein
MPAFGTVLYTPTVSLTKEESSTCNLHWIEKDPVQKNYYKIVEYNNRSDKLHKML